jgi:crossover junction endodeoxyribonuclease RuvC
MVIGIDPGLNYLGVAILEKKDEKNILVHWEQIETNGKKESLSERLHMIFKRLDQIMKEYSSKLTTLSIEESFVNMNNKSSLKLGMVVGLALTLGAKYHLDIKIFSPTEVKHSITGNGRASKNDISFFLKYMIDIPENLSSHIYDAIAIALLGVN